MTALQVTYGYQCGMYPFQWAPLAYSLPCADHSHCTPARLQIVYRGSMHALTPSPLAMQPLIYHPRQQVSRVPVCAAPLNRASPLLSEPETGGQMASTSHTDGLMSALRSVARLAMSGLSWLGGAWGPRVPDKPPG